MKNQETLTGSCALIFALAKLIVALDDMGKWRSFISNNYSRIPFHVTAGKFHWYPSTLFVFFQRFESCNSRFVPSCCSTRIFHFATLSESRLTYNERSCSSSIFVCAVGIIHVFQAFTNRFSVWTHCNKKPCWVKPVCHSELCNIVKIALRGHLVGTFFVPKLNPCTGWKSFTENFLMLGCLLTFFGYVKKKSVDHICAIL